jgi:dsDNA-specific endonuclease/ATPase MutS2
MNYSIERYLKTLELDKILELLANEATLTDAKDMARELIPDNDVQMVEKKWLIRSTIALQPILPSL